MFSLALLLRAAGLSRSTFYYHAGMVRTADRYAAVKTRIRQLHKQHKGCYGYRRMTDVLRRSGEHINHKTVQKLMRLLGLQSLIRRRKYRSYRGAGHVLVANILQREFEACRPNEKWVTDVSEFNVRGEKLYLSPVMDLYNGEIVAYEMAGTPQYKLVDTMLSKALKKLGGEEKLLLHSDQGWQYQMSAYRRTLEKHGLVQSMSRKGNCLDNAAMESFFGTLKSECFYLSKFSSIDQLKMALRKYIHYYNHHRIKTKLKGLSPVQYRTQAFGP